MSQEPVHQIAYRLAGRLAAELAIEAEPFAALPLALWQNQGSRFSYAYPLPATGRWVGDQGVITTSMILADLLITKHNHLLSAKESHLLASAVQFPQAVLRFLRPYLPSQAMLMQTSARVAHVRMAFKDGWLDTSTLQFQPLPYCTDHFVFQVTVPHSFKQLMQLDEETLAQTSKQLAEYLPNKEERDWFVTYIGRALCPADPSKCMLCLTDSLEPSLTPGNAAKSTLLQWIQAAVGEAICSLSSGDCLTVARSQTLTKSQLSVIQCFDELTRAQGKGAAQKLDLGRVKFLTSGARAASLLVAANVGDWPDLQALNQEDPAFIRRLVMLPARARFGQYSFADFHTQLEGLSADLCRLFLDGFLEYKHSCNQLLHVPASMQTFKDLVMRCSTMQTYNAHHLGITREWVQRSLSFQNHKSINVHVLCALFSGACGNMLAATLNNKGHNFMHAQQCSAGVLDAVLVSFGVVQQNGMFYGVELQAGTT